MTCLRYQLFLNPMILRGMWATCEKRQTVWFQQHSIVRQIGKLLFNQKSFMLQYPFK